MYPANSMVIFQFANWWCSPEGIHFEPWTNYLGFPYMGVPLNPPFIDGIFHYKPSIWGNPWQPPWLWKAPYSLFNFQCLDNQQIINDNNELLTSYFEPWTNVWMIYMLIYHISTSINICQHLTYINLYQHMSTEPLFWTWDIPSKKPPSRLDRCARSSSMVRLELWSSTELDSRPQGSQVLAGSCDLFYCETMGKMRVIYGNVW